MFLGHGMVNGDKMLILHLFNSQQVIIVRFFRFQRRQRDAAAADNRVAKAVNGIAADGAYIEFAPQHIAGGVPVDDMLPVHQFNDGDAQCLRQRLQQADVRQTLGCFPFGNGLAADTDAFCQFCLSHVSAFPKLLDGRTGHISVHGCHFLSEKSIPRKAQGCNLRIVGSTILDDKKRPPWDEMVFDDMGRNESSDTQWCADYRLSG